MKNVLLSKLRDKNLNMPEFRWAANQLAEILAGEAAEFLPKGEIKVETPLNVFYNGTKFAKPIILVPIFRSGLALVPVFAKFFLDAKIGCLGLKRDEETAIPKLYYKNMPKINGDESVILLDPMIATGGSAIAAIDILKENGVKEENIIFVAVIGSRQGVDHVQNSFPKIKIIIPAIDEKLNDKFFIVPGLGDFGDRFFGTRAFALDPI